MKWRTDRPFPRGPDNAHRRNQPLSLRCWTYRCRNARAGRADGATRPVGQFLQPSAWSCDEPSVSAALVGEGGTGRWRARRPREWNPGVPAGNRHRAARRSGISTVAARWQQHKQKNPRSRRGSNLEFGFERRGLMLRRYCIRGVLQRLLGVCPCSVTACYELRSTLTAWV